MTNLTLNTSLFDQEGTYETYVAEILLDGNKVGRADIIIDTEDDAEVFLEWIGIDEEFRGQGLGTQVMTMLAKEYGFIYFAPADERNQELYERIAKEYDTNTPEVDQGYGVYYMEGK